MIYDHETLRAMNKALAQKYGYPRTSMAIDAALRISNIPSVGHVPIQHLTGFHRKIVIALEGIGHDHPHS